MDEHAFPPTGFLCRSARPFVTFGGSGGMMTTAKSGLPYPCSPQAMTRDESSQRGKYFDGIASLGNMQISNSRLCESSKCWVYTAVNHPWWMSMLFHGRDLLWLGSLHTLWVQVRTASVRPRRGGYNEYPQCMFWIKNKKTVYIPANTIPANPSFSSFSIIYHAHVFLMY